MFEGSVSLSRFTAGSNIESIEGRIQQLETMISAVDTQRLKAAQSNLYNRVSTPAPTTGKPSFAQFLGTATPPPKVQPVMGELQERCQAIQPLVEKYAAQYGVDPKLVNAVIRQESGFNPNAVSSCGARGLMQLMPGTAKDLGVKNSFDPEQNLEGGIRHLSGLMGKYQGNVALALAAYNAGGGAVDRNNGIPPYQETQRYVRKILAAYLAGGNDG